MTKQTLYDFEELEADARFIRDRIEILKLCAEKLAQNEGRLKEQEVPTMFAEAVVSMQEVVLRLKRAKTEIQNAYEEEDNAPQIQL